MSTVYIGAALFFISFFRISLIYNSAYLSIFISLLSLIVLVLSKNTRFEFFDALGTKVVSLFVMLFIWVLLIDLYTGTIINAPNAAFAIRLVSLFLLSICPAFFINKFFIKGDDEKFLIIIGSAFIVQTLFWLLTYLFPPIKISLYNIMGASGSVNLREYNLEARGFGLSNEINFTTPFMMAYLAIVYFRSYVFKSVIFLTQIFNSNLVVIALSIGLANSKISFIKKALIVVLSIPVLFYILGAYVPRLSAELDGFGMQTLDTLLGDHFFFLGDSLVDYIFGCFRYVFHDQDLYRSDIGWIIMINQGGVVLLLLFCILSTLLAFKVSDRITSFIVMISMMSLLNFKGFILGPNALMFSMFFIIYHNYYALKNSFVD